MKIIIDIPDKLYKRISMGLVLGEVCECVKNGTPLNKIRAEIESQRKEASNKHSEDNVLQAYYDGLNDGLKDARDTLDKYKTESEE